MATDGPVFTLNNRTVACYMELATRHNEGLHETFIANTTVRHPGIQSDGRMPG